MQFDHEKLDVYQVSLQFVTYVGSLAPALKAEHRHARDQLLRSSQSIPLNIAEGNGKLSYRDRNRFFEIARGSAMESAATLDVLVALGACSNEDVEKGKALLLRVVAMLSRMTENRGAAREDAACYGEGAACLACSDYEHEHAHEHDQEMEQRL